MYYVAVAFTITLWALSIISGQSENITQTQFITKRMGLLENWLYTSNPKYIRFLLFPEPENEDYYDEIYFGDISSLQASQFDSRKPLILLIHGLIGHHATLTDIGEVKNAYLSIRQNANLIMVDYRELAGTRFPFLLSWLNGIASLPANLNMGIIGKRVAEFLQFLLTVGALRSPGDVHIVGHSLGCHVAGRAGEIIAKNGQGVKIRRISGLDCPFGQVFKNLLDKSDAHFVDVTYTSFGLGGILGNTGHADFFINGGQNSQPNCPNALFVTDPYCAHASSVFYFAKSIRNKHIYGCECDICWMKPRDCSANVRYGHFMNTRTRGMFYVDIPAKPRRIENYPELTFVINPR